MLWNFPELSVNQLLVSTSVTPAVGGFGRIEPFFYRILDFSTGCGFILWSNLPFISTRA